MSTKAQQKATAKYESKNYDKILIRLKKGNKKALRNYCNINNLTINGLVNNLLAEYCKQHDIDFKR